MNRQHYILLFVIGFCAAVLGGLFRDYLQEKEILKFNKKQ